MKDGIPVIRKRSSTGRIYVGLAYRITRVHILMVCDCILVKSLALNYMTYRNYHFEGYYRTQALPIGPVDS